MDPRNDAVIIGAGFSGIYLYHHLRKHGYIVAIYETGNDIGGVWHWNNYPGARVDTNGLIYQLPDSELYFEYSQTFPSRDEIMSYFDHVDATWDIKAHVNFNMTLTHALYSKESNHWNLTIKSEIDSTLQSVTTRFLFLCTGFASSRYIPNISGMNSFHGDIHHSSYWPKDRQVDVKGKRIAIIGTGASGVQLVQDLGPQCQHLTIYQRTPNLALPMKQKQIQNGTYTLDGSLELWKRIRTTFGGLEMPCTPKEAMTDSPEQRRKLYEELYENGGLGFLFRGYKDLLTSLEANSDAYAFWAEKTRSRITDLKKPNMLAPVEAPHPIGSKRCSLEQNYYEVCNLKHVDIINVNVSPILEIVEAGIQTKDGLVEVDIIIFATGFDGLTGGIVDIDIRVEDGLSLKEKWAIDGVVSYLGLAVPNFPNMFYTYGHQAPTALSNGPTCIEIQGEWLIELLMTIKTKNILEVEVDIDYAQEWTHIVKTCWHGSLFPLAKSNWYHGTNIPGKLEQPLLYKGGIPSYIQTLQQCSNNAFKGFHFKYKS